MRALASVVACWLLSNGLSAQRENYIRYNRLIDRAMVAAAHGEHERALLEYDSAFAIRHWVITSYFDATLVALEAGQFEKANDYLIQAVENGFVPSIFNDPLYDSFLGSEKSIPFRSVQAGCGSRFAEHADSATIRALEVMHARDQMYRDGSAGMLHNDSLNMEALIAICESAGFPTERVLGSTFGTIWLMLWHHRGAEYPASSQWRRILPFVRTAIAAGELDPSFLCMFDDLADHDTGRPMRYGALVYYFSNVPEELYLVDRAQLNVNRRSVGWGTIEDFAFQSGSDISSIRFAAP